MSLFALDWALNQEVLSSSRKFVLVILANHANDVSGNAFPSIETICRQTGLDRKTVIKAIDELIEAGHITDTGRRAGVTQRVKVYHFPILTVPKTEPLDGQTVEKQSRNSAANGGGIVPLMVGKQSQKRNSEPEPEPEPEPKTKKGEAPAPVLKNELEKAEDWQLEKDLKAFREANKSEVDDGVKSYRFKKIAAIKAEMNRRRGNSNGGSSDPLLRPLGIREQEIADLCDDNPRNKGICKSPATDYNAAFKRKLERQEAERKAKQEGTGNTPEQPQREVGPIDWSKLKEAIKERDPNDGQDWRNST